MEKVVKKQKEKVKVDKDRVGNTFNCLYDYTVDIGNGQFYSPVTKKVYKEINVNTTNDLPDNNKTRY
jgi:hypothetical protein